MKKQLMASNGLMFSVCVLLIQLFLANCAVAAGGRAMIAEPVNQLGASLDTGPAGISESRSDHGQVVRLSLKSLGLPSRLRLVGAKVESGIDFSFHTLDVVERLRLKVRYEYSPTLNPELSTLTVLLNGKPVGALPLLRENSRDAHATLEIDPILLQEWNHLTFHLDAHLEAPMCDDPRNPQIWVQMNSKDTVIEANVVTLPLTNDLSQFPVPFFDKHDTQDLKLHFVLPDHPSWSVLKSAGILSSWFGSLTDWRKVHFPSHLNEIPEQDAIVLATSADHIDGIELPPVTDGVAIISMIDNPKNPDARLLLVVGRDEKGLIEAAQALTLGKVKLEGSTQSVQTLSLSKRLPFDAPKWLPGKKVRLGDIVPADKLVATGLFVTPYQMVLHLPPNLYRSESETIPLDFSFDSNNNSRYVVRVDALINGKVFDFKTFGEPAQNTVPVKENETPMLRRQLLFNIPTQKLTGQDTITVQFVFADKSHDICNTAFVRDEIRVDPNSTIDLTGLSRYVTLPDLSYLAYSGYPFSKMADLSETAVLLPVKPDRHEIESMLIALGHIGNKTGYPATSVTIASIRDAEKFADKDILLVGANEHIRPILDDWSGDIQVNVFSDFQPIPRWGSRYLQRWAEWIVLSTQFNKKPEGSHGMVMAGFESPLQAKRSVVMLTAADSSSLPEEASVLNTFNFAKDFVGDVTVIADKDTYDRVDSFERARHYSIGELSLWEHAKKFVHHNPWLAVFIAMVIGLFFASMSYRKLKRVSEEKARQELM